MFIKGPVLGAWLYYLGGFEFPFVVSGLIGVILSVLLIVSIPSSNELQCSGGNQYNELSDSLQFTTDMDNNNMTVENEKISKGTISGGTKRDERKCLIRKLDRRNTETKLNPNNEIGYEI